MRKYPNLNDRRSVAKELRGNFTMLSSTITFRKELTCPSAESLLAYHEAALENAHGVWIATHLAACEFCGAELHLLKEHVPVEAHCTSTEIPLNLRRLAESLLDGCCFNLENYIGAGYEKSPLTLTDA
jgi:hypothetical protein